MRWAFSRYRLEFKHPFTTAHGSRTGTDSVFVRLEHAGEVGYGEATLPPYLKEKPEEVVDALRRIAGLEIDGPAKLLELVQQGELPTSGGAGTRAAIHTALVDLIGKKKQLTANEVVGCADLKNPVTLVTIDILPLPMVKARLQELPESGGLKVKVKDSTSVAIVRSIIDLDQRPLLLDANQGLPDVRTALELINAANSRLLGLEQPFKVTNGGAQQALSRTAGTWIYADEAVANMAELELLNGDYNGLNIKLMKCGGLDRAKALAARAGELGMRVMLGSMSESSLGCTALGHLAGMADLLDLDGPVLIKNDPFVGAEMKQGRFVMPTGPGVGVEKVIDLDFSLA